jgi:hypothetical protein
MHSAQGNMLQSLRAVEEFLDANANKIDGIVNTGTRRKLAETIGSLQTYVAEQAGSNIAAQGATQRTQKLRRALVRDHMAPIARIAQADLPPTVPELEALRAPRSNDSIERLAAAAYGMAAAATPFADTFVKAGLAPDFIAKLSAAADAMLQSVSERAQNRGKWSGATKGLKTTLSSGRKLVTVIDAFVESALVNDPALLANWKRVKRVKKVPARANGAPALPASPTPVAALLPGTAVARQETN